MKSRIHTNLAAHKIYCKEIETSFSGHVEQQGFTASAKIEECINLFQKVPDTDKAIILSFFKGGLDLLEGILTEDFGICCARYDGDVDKDTRNKDLDRFKTTDDCRVLLATVQSGGTGLNITEANVSNGDDIKSSMVDNKYNTNLTPCVSIFLVFIAYLFPGSMVQCK